MLPLIFLSIAALPLPAEVAPQLFPDGEKRTPAELEVAGLMALYPGHVLPEKPRENPPANAGRKALIVELPREVYYMRIYDLASALPNLADNLTHAGLILDLRYVTGDAAAAEAFALLLNKAGLASAPVHSVGLFPEPKELPATAPTDKEHSPPLVLTLVNEMTSGPLEAWLEAFQEKESVLAVGTHTLGQPGKYRSYTGHPGYFIIEGELRPESGSIVGTGLKPRFLVNVTPEQNMVAYSMVEQKRMDILNMLRQERTVAPTPATVAATGTASGASPSPTQQSAPASTQSTTITLEARDPVLQRAVDVVAALQVLGRLPSSQDTGTTKAPTKAAVGTAK